MAEPDVSEQAARSRPRTASLRTRPGQADGADRRAELIAAAQARWVDALTDLGGRNTLLYYKDRRTGTLDLAQADPDAWPASCAPARSG